MGTSVPLLNEYKREFLAKRLPQTILGGLKLKIGYDAPVYVYINQIILFLIPFLLGGLFTLLVELGTMEDHIAVYVYGGLMMVFVIVTQLVSTFVQGSHSTDLSFVKKKNLLSEEDEVDFISCCDSETFKFVVPPKKYKINIIIHALVSGPMCALCLWYLLPTTLNNIYYSNTGGVVVIFILGWLTVCIGQYPLTTAAPPETATYRTTDILELSALMRAFYIFIFILFDLLYRFLSTDFLLTNQVLHVIFIFLPLFWTLGVLSPVDAFILYVFEQAHVFLFGGSFMASDIRLCVMLVLSVSTFLGAYYINASLGSVILSACVGYALSTDLGGLGSQLITFCTNRNKVSASTTDLKSEASKKRSFLWRWGIFEFLYHFVMLAIVGVTSGLLNYNSNNISSDVWYGLGYCIIGLCVTEKILRDIQGVFIIFGAWRNSLFPSTVQTARSFERRKLLLKPLGIIRRGIVNWVAPLIMLSYLSITVKTSAPTSFSFRSGMDLSTGVWYVFGVVRVFRWVWQNTVHSLLELSVVHIVMVTNTSNSIVTMLGVPVLAMIIGLCRDRFYQFLNKTYFFFTLLISSWSDKKQRRGSTIPIIIISFILLPVILAIIILASAISVPLLPLFTLPLFFISFPRPLRSWPEPVGASANSCPDTNFYKQLAPELSKAFSTAFSDGSLGEPCPGNNYLVRFQDRLVWVMVLERGASYCTINIKGLELQETSCHTAEAARIDDIFEFAFERPENGSVIGCPNEYLLHTLTPADACYLKAYSDARNVLTGIIDNPSASELTMNSFLKSLVWVLLKHVNKLKQKKGGKSKKFDKELSFIAKNEKHELKEMNQNHITKVVVEAEIKKDPVLPLLPEFVKEDRPNKLPPISVSKEKEKIMASSWGSLDSFTDSIFSDDGNLTKKPKKSKPVTSKPPPPPARNKSPEIEDLFEELDIGLPAYDVTKPKPMTQNKFGTKSYGTNTIYKPQTNLPGSPDFKSPYSSQMSLPQSWRELPLDNSQVSRLLNKFPKDWYKHVLACLDWSSSDQAGEKIIKEVLSDDALLNCYAQLTMACYSIFDNQGYSGPSFLYRSYLGDVPFNAMMDWLNENQDLLSLVKQAFRYGFKLMLDQTLLGEATTNAELQEYLEEYDRDWYIGLEKDPEWTAAILESRPNLFSLGHNNTQNTYSSRTLTLQSMQVNIGRLNPEVVRGQWANLGLELLYLTNDDEERYSIQAHPTILRNLTVQAADPPLGYPIYSSEPISVPVL